MEQTAREKQSELMEVHYKLSEQGKRLSECVNRLCTIGNKLLDESANIAEQKGAPKEPNHRLPGLVSDLNSDAEGFKFLINDLEKQIQKLEPIF